MRKEQNWRPYDVLHFVAMRAEYHWHTIALMAYEDIQRGKNDGDVAKSYGMSTQAIHTLTEARDYAEQYLQAIGKRDQWSLVGDRYAFEQMVKCRRKLQTQGEKELFEALAFKFILGGSTDGRLYEVIPSIAEHLDAIAKELETKIEILPAGEPTPERDEADDLDLLAGEEDVSVDTASSVAAAVSATEDISRELVC